MAKSTIERIREATEHNVRMLEEEHKRLDLLTREVLLVQTKLLREYARRLAVLEGTVIGLLLRELYDGSSGVGEVLRETVVSLVREDRPDGDARYGRARF